MTLINKHYVDAKILKYKEPIDGHFKDATAEILRMLQGSDESEDESSTDESSEADSGSE